MATQTDYFHLKKPESYENYNIAVFNDNADTIDLQMHNNQVSAAKVMVGATSLADGESGRVPPPHAGDEDKFLKGDGTWAEAGSSNVEANPSGTPTETLETIGIDNVIYQLPEGGETEITGDAEGSIISIDDGKLNAPLKACTVDINPVQSGSGTPSPSNIRPISGWSSVRVTRCGINLFDYNNYEDIDVTGTSILRKGHIFPSGTYTIRNNSNSDELYYKTVKDDKSSYSSASQVVMNNVRNVTIATGYLLYVYSNSELQNVFVGQGENQPYTAYNGTTYSISWQTEAGTIYGGELDVTTGVLTVDRVIVDLGTLTWGKYQDDKFYATISNLKIPITTADRNKGMICSQYKPSETLTVSEIQDQSFLKFNQSENFWIRDSNYNDATAFGTAMSGVQLVYELATPTTVSLTPTQITTLYGDNVIWADSGDIAITYVRDTSIAINDALNQSITPTYSSGTKLADYNVGGHTGAIYVQGAGGHKDVLWTGSETPTMSYNPTIQLAHPISDYDFLLINFNIDNGAGRYLKTTLTLYGATVGDNFAQEFLSVQNAAMFVNVINDYNITLNCYGGNYENTTYVSIIGVKL